MDGWMDVGWMCWMDVSRINDSVFQSYTNRFMVIIVQYFVTWDRSIFYFFITGSFVNGIKKFVYGVLFVVPLHMQICHLPVTQFWADNGNFNYGKFI